jgi:peptide/nickel transport system permease protein
MISYIIRRSLMAIPILIGITIISFAIMHIAPGGPTALMMDPNIKPGDMDAYMEKYGLNDPVHIQYFKWLGNMMQGDFGNSLIRQGAPVNEMIMNRLPNTLLLMFVSTFFGVMIAIPFGVFSATRQYSTIDYSVTVTSFLGLATPNFWLGLMLIMFVSVKLGWFPTGGVATLNEPFSIWDRIHHLILPAFVLGTAEMASIARFSRSSMLEVLKQDYMRTARAKGFKERKVVIKHGIRNGLLPIITIFGLILPSLFGGSVVTEKVFGWPGLGLLFIDSVFQRDYPVIMAITLISAVLVVIGSLIADILYAIVDPRIEY